ncbi:MAG: hydrogenase maturation protease [Desulfobacterales bacterium]|nr:hydrogenase maturation protease [Desulfobacterales bacterium]
MGHKKLVLGIGNTLLGDDGVGIYIARKIRAECNREDSIDVKETSLGGIALLDLVAEYEKVIIVDAIITKRERAGTIYKLSLEDLGNIVDLYMLHAIDLKTAIELGRMLGYHIPENITIYAIEIQENTTFTEGLSPEIEEAVPSVIRRVLKDLQ